MSFTINLKARVVLCGGISRYNQTGAIPGPVNYFNLIYRRARMEGFIVIDYMHRAGEAIDEGMRWADTLASENSRLADVARWFPFGNGTGSG